MYERNTRNIKVYADEERMEVLNTLREYLKQLEDENPKPIYYNAKLNGQ